MKTPILTLLLVSVLLSACAPPAPPSSSPSAASVPAAAVVAAPADTAVAASDPQFCALNSADAWDACIGKPVDIRGRYPTTLAQHPLLAPPAMSGSAPVTQTYLETPDGRQIIVLVEGEVTACPAAMRVRGTLQAVDLGGAEGTPESYRGWAVHRASVSCE